MSFTQIVAAKYLVQASYSETFELTDEIAKFMTKNNLWDDVEVAATAKPMSDRERAAKNQPSKENIKNSLKQKGDLVNFFGGGGGGNHTPPPKKTKEFMKYPLGTELRLKKEVQEDLARTEKLFKSYKYAEERFASAKAAWKKDVNDAIKDVAKKMKIEPRGIKVEVGIHEPGSYTVGNYGGYVTITYKGQELEWEPQGLWYQPNDGAQMDDAASSWNWAAWLGIDASPFHDDRWVDAYLYDQASSWFEEAGDVEADSLKRKLKKLFEEAHEDQAA